MLRHCVDLMQKVRVEYLLLLASMIIDKYFNLYLKRTFQGSTRSFYHAINASEAR